VVLIFTKPIIFFITLIMALTLLVGCTDKNNLIRGININLNKELDAQVNTKIPVSVPVENNISVRIKKDIPVNVPIKQTFEVPVRQDVDVKINKMVLVPIDQDINVNAVIPVDTIVPIDTIVTAIVNIPLVGNVEIGIPVKANVPVRINVPIQNQKVHVADNINFLFNDKVTASIDDVIYVPIDTLLKTNVEVDDIFYVPVRMNVDSLIPINQKIPVRINQTLSIDKGDITLIR